MSEAVWGAFLFQVFVLLSVGDASSGANRAVFGR